jgi:hypothetical protein
MIELLPSLSAAISTLQKIKEVTDKQRFAELKNLIGDLSLQLADLKIGMAALIEENHDLVRQLRALENPEDDPCPRCKQNAYRLEESKEDPNFGFMGARVHFYKCLSCNYTDQKSDGLH